MPVYTTRTCSSPVLPRAALVLALALVSLSRPAHAAAGPGPASSWLWLAGRRGLTVAEEEVDRLLLGAADGAADGATERGALGVAMFARLARLAAEVEPTAFRPRRPPPLIEMHLSRIATCGRTCCWYLIDTRGDRMDTL